MKATTIIKTDRELFDSQESDLVESSNIKIMTIGAARLKAHLNTTVYLRSSMFILVLNGRAEIEINFRRYNVSEEGIILLSFGHFFRIKLLSPDFRCVVLYVSKQYIDEMFSTEMIYERVRYGVRMHKTPLLQLHGEETDLLGERLELIRSVVSNDQHRYYRKMILSGLLLFFLDLGNIIEKENSDEGIGKPGRDDIYFQQFLELLVLYYRSEHQVEYYAEKLHITTHYLTLIVKRVSGQTVSDLIYQLLFSEAKLLLQQPKLSIQQIAEELHFSDQSAFGKFFKRKSGLSPKEFAQQTKTERA